MCEGGVRTQNGTQVLIRCVTDKSDFWCQSNNYDRSVLTAAAAATCLGSAKNHLPSTIKKCTTNHCVTDSND